MDDEKYYQVVADEIRDGRIRDALWTKAIAKSMGDENKTKAVYIQLRVEQLMQEENRTRIEEKLHPDAAENQDEAGESTVERTSNQPNEAAKFIAIVVLVIVILFVFKKMVWPKLQTYF